MTEQKYLDFLKENKNNPMLDRSYELYFEYRESLKSIFNCPQNYVLFNFNYNSYFYISK